MKRPPVLARAVDRGLSPFRGKRAAHLLPRARLGGPMPWVIAIMVGLTVLAAGGALSLDNLADSARGDLEGSATVQIIDADREGRDRQARAAADALSRAPNVASLRVVPEDELEALLEPWIGGGEEARAVPVPALIDVRLRGPADERALDQLRLRLAESAPDARIDAQSEWLAPVFGAINALSWMAIGLIALLAFTSGAAVWLAARNALGTNRDTIEIVHLLGGNDAQIARIFQRSILLDALLGGLVGMALGVGGIMVMGAQFSALESGMVAAAGLDPADWLVLALIPLAAVALAVLTARSTVLASLRKML